ncbi:MAG: hypothetical protein AB8H03_28730 [Saprospiraceae bacterium]
MFILKNKDEGKIKLPYCDWDNSIKNAIEFYYYNTRNWQEGIEHLYGGKPLIDLVSKLEVKIEDVLTRTIKISLYSKFGVVHISNLSFRQLLVESSYRYGDGAGNKIEDWQKDGWNIISPQQRVEICQNELSRWSVIIIDPSKPEWDNGIPAEINLQNGAWIEYLEIINNCTTSRGFELKLKYQGETYHGSFLMHQKEYQKLCKVQSGAWANQGWRYCIDPRGYYPSLIKTDTKPTTDNPTFGMIYHDAEKANNKILLDLNQYRDIVPSSERAYSPKINHGEIIYTRWGKNKEYFEKPHQRKLVIAVDEKRFIDPPKSYAEILNPVEKSGDFRLPEFREDGLYDILKPQVKNKYHQLKKINNIIISKTSVGLDELEIRCADPESETALHKIVIGNIDLNSEEIKNGFLTIDRFCFNPRKTISFYQHDWLPAAEKFGADKEAVYAFLLGAKNDYQNSHGHFKGHIYIQPESWGLERAILKREGNILTIDLISYERIIPIWQASINLDDENKLLI